MVKVVENNERICTVNLDGSECSIVFQSYYKYFTVKNESDSEVYISLKRDIVPEADGVMTVKSKESATITNMQPNVNMFFASGSGKIQVFASNSDKFVNPFKLAPVQNGGGGKYEYGMNFKSHNILTDTGLTLYNDCGEIQIDGEKVTVTVAANLSIKWCRMISGMQLNRTKVYKLVVKNFSGYGRIGISNCSSNPNTHEGLNAVSTDFDSYRNDNYIFDYIHTEPIHFMIIPSANTDITSCGLWFCTDINRDDIGTDGFTFELELFESEG